MAYYDDMTRSNGGTPHDVSRLRVPEAARSLGISPEAVRNRLSRGTLNSVRENGRVFVLVDRDMVRNTGDIPTDTPQESSAVIDAKDEMISMLQGQLEAERQASAELRRIVAGLVQRVPELEPSRAPQEVSRADGEASAGEDTLIPFRAIDVITSPQPQPTMSIR